jgi:predicted helicase
VLNVAEESLGDLFGGVETNFVIDQARRLLPVELSTDHENLLRLFYFIYAQMFSNEYRLIFKDELQRDYPHLFMPADLSIFEIISDVGQRLVEIHSGDESPADVSTLDDVGVFDSAIERPQFVDGTIWLDSGETFGFTGVPSEVWNLEIGGYKICEKWLKDRKGLKLTKGDRSIFLDILATLVETLRLQGQIDQIIESNGGWDKTFLSPITNSVG